MKGYTVVISMEVNDTEKVLYTVNADTKEAAKKAAVKELQTVAEKKSYKTNGENIFTAFDGDTCYYATIWED